MSKSAKIREKLKVSLLGKLFFYAMVLFLPFGTRKIFLTELSNYFDYHIFYNTFYLYLTDLVFLGLIIAWIWESLIVSREISSTPSQSPPSHGGENQSILHRITTRIKQDRIYWFIFTFWLILAISVIVSRETYLGFYGLWKITELMLIFAYARENLSISRETPASREGVFWLILATLWFQAGFAIWQFVNQKSIGLSVLGEERLLPGLSGIAEFFSREMILIRAYGTLPHPNVLAGLLAVGVMINLWMLYAHNSSQPPLTLRGGENISRETPPLKVRGGKGALLILSLSLILLTTGLVVTFSRFIWAITGLALILWFTMIFTKLRKKDTWAMRTGRLKEESRMFFPGRVMLISFLLVGSLVLNLAVFGKPIQDRLFGAEAGPAGGLSSGAGESLASQSLEERNIYSNIALLMIKDKPIFGMGLKNFVAAMDEYAEARLLPFMHQPAHNIFLLITAESGLLALFVFLVILFLLLQNIVRHEKSALKYSLLVMFLILISSSLVDHYFWTIQQGQLTFWILLGLFASKQE